MTWTGYKRMRWGGRTGLALLLVFLGGVAARAESGAEGVWVGRYACGQGETGMVLTIAAPPARSLFYFHPAPPNPGVPEGCFEMDGAYDPATRRISLTAGRWIVRPFGYVTVDLAGVVSADGMGMSGTVLGPWCADFSVRRVPAPQAPGSERCQPKAPTVSSR